MRPVFNPFSTLGISEVTSLLPLAGHTNGPCAPRAPESAQGAGAGYGLMDPCITNQHPSTRVPPPLGPYFQWRSLADLTEI